MAKKLSAKILERLLAKSSAGKAAIRNELSRIRREHRTITLNGAAQIYAEKRGFTLMRMLDDEDRASMPNIAHASIFTSHAPRRAGSPRIKPVVPVLTYPLSDPFAKAHLDEVNRDYQAGSYTSAAIMSRKIFENLIVNEILLVQFPEKNPTNRALYFDDNQKRFKDFSVIAKNLFDKRDEFLPSCRKPIERLCARLKPFMGEANDYTHSWYHLCDKKDFDGLKVQEVADLIQYIADCIKVQ